MTQVASTPAAAGIAEAPPVSVVIPTYRRDDLLRRCLDVVLDQQYPADRIEVIVVDDARSPTTRGVVESVRQRHPAARIDLFEGTKSGPAAARNIGWRAATSELVAFIDDDAYPAAQDWLALGVAEFADPDVQGVSGAVQVPVPDRPTDFQRNVQHLEHGQFLTCNAFYRRAALEAVGGFDERFAVPFREDSDLQFRLEAAGARLITSAAPVVVHPAPEGPWGVSLRLQRYSMFNALLYKKHPQRYRREIQPRPPLQYYAMVGLLAAALVALLRGKWGRAAVLFGTWAVLQGRFFAKRIRGTRTDSRHLADMAVTSILIPPLSIYWRIRGAIRFRVWFI